ncbi:MAG: hypothetical protein AB8G14_17895 [Ilumatobacter sp.]
MSRTIRRVAHAMLAVAAFIAAVVLAGAGDRAPVADAAAPRDQRVMLVTDSVGLGTRGILDDFFPTNWDVSVVGEPARFVEQLESNFVRPNLFRTGDHVVIAGGYNYPFWDPARFERSVDSIINTLTNAGVKHVYWVTLREVKPEFVSPSAWRQVQPFFWYFPTVNDHLRDAVARHDNLTLIDWSANADRTGITYDAIHLNRTGAELYSSLIASAVRDASTRSPERGITRVNVASPAEVASGAVSAVAVNLTSVRGRTRGYVSAYPCEQGSSPSSNLNHQRGQVIAGAALVPVGPSGDICVFNRRAGHLVVDVFGTFGAEVDVVHATPERVLDTRQPNGSSRQPAGVEHRVPAVDAERAGGSAAGAPGSLERVVALNLTVTQASAKGFATVHECGSEPSATSNVNFRAGVATPNLVITRTDDTGEICVTTTSDAHVIVDVLAVFGAQTSMTTQQPERVVDTRGGSAPRAGDIIEIEVPTSDGSDAGGGVIANLTIPNPRFNGFASVFACDDGAPATSNINFRVGVTIANAVIVEPDADDKICVMTNVAADVVVDVLGRTGEGFTGTGPTRAHDTRS